jgi:hypothetical protein
VAANAHAPERGVHRQHADVAPRQLLVMLQLSVDGLQQRCAAEGLLALALHTTQPIISSLKKQR